MVSPEETEATQKPLQTSEQTQPKLSMSFFQELLDLPACKTIGVCDGCGRCER